MADKPGQYWDHEQCGWVRYPVPAPSAPKVEIPEQPTAVEAEREADVRSG